MVMNAAVRLQAVLSALSLGGIAALFFQFAGATDVPLPVNLQSSTWNAISRAVYNLDFARALGLSFFWLPVPISVRLLYLLVTRRMPVAADSIAYVLAGVATIGSLFMWFRAGSAFTIEGSTAVLIPIAAVAMMARRTHCMRLLACNGIFALQAAYISGAICALEATFPFWHGGALLTLVTLVVYFVQVVSMQRITRDKSRTVGGQFAA
jgi:hypothetical protein